MDIVDVLKEDHQEIEALFGRIQDASSRAVKTKQTLFQKLNTALTLHVEIEEQILYPRMYKLAELRHQTLDSYEEHRLVKQLLAELSTDCEGGEAWDAKLRVLLALIHHHVQEEEAEDFQILKEKLGTEELQLLGQSVVDFKAGYEAPDSTTMPTRLGMATGPSVMHHG